MVGARIPCFIFVLFFFFFFWINRLCTSNSQKPSLELQSPKSQGFNFNWFSCCKYNPYPPLWTFFFVWPMWIPKFQFFFFFFPTALASHSLPLTTPQGSRKKSHHPPQTGTLIFFFSISQPAVSIFHGFSLTPPPYTGIYFNKKTNNFLCTHPVVDTHRIFIQPRSSLSWFFNFFFFHSAQSNHTHTTMSLFQMGMNSLEVNDAKLTMAELELESLTSLFNK